MEAGLSRLFALAESYPELKADKLLSEAMDTYRDTEENLAAARRFYNSAVKDMNDRTEIFPGSLVAVMIGVKAYPFFHAEEGKRGGVNAADYLK